MELIEKTYFTYEQILKKYPLFNLVFYNENFLIQLVNADFIIGVSRFENNKNIYYFQEQGLLAFMDIRNNVLNEKMTAIKGYVKG